LSNSTSEIIKDNKNNINASSNTDKNNNFKEEDLNKKNEKTDNISNSASSEENEKGKRQKVYLNSQTTLPEEKSYTSRLVTSIPIKISIEFDRKANVQSIIDAVKNMKELELEKTSFYTNLILVGHNLHFINTENKIDECFQNNQTIDIYEFLNHNSYNEIIWQSKNQFEYLKVIDKFNCNNTTSASEMETKKLNSDKNCFDIRNKYSSNDVGMNCQSQLALEKDFDKKNNEDELLSICYETLTNFRMPILDYNMENKDIKFEYLVEINHRFVIEKEYNLFYQGTFKMNNFFFDAILINNSVN
jgi:hypothetical protein